MISRKGIPAKKEVEHSPLDGWAADILRLLCILTFVCL